jgi:hypothetical protein
VDNGVSKLKLWEGRFDDGTAYNNIVGPVTATSAITGGAGSSQVEHTGMMLSRS